MVNEINPIEALNSISLFLRKFTTYKRIKLPKITLNVYYKLGPGKGVVAIENAEVNEIQRKMCHSLLLKMINTDAVISNTIDHETDEKVGAISTEFMIIVMAGVESMAAKAIIARALFHSQVISDQMYQIIKDTLKQKALFAILEKS